MNILTKQAITITSEIKGSLLAITSGLFYGLVGYFGLNLIASDLSISNMQFWRFFIASQFILFYVILSKKLLLKDKGVDILKAFFAGALFYSPSAMVYFLASKYIGTGLSMVILFTFPAYVMLLNGLFYKEKIDKKYYFAVILMIFGLLQLGNFSDLKFNLIGIGLGILAAILYAFYIISSKRINVPPTLSTLMVSSGCATSCLFFSLVNNHFTIPTHLFQWLLIFGFGIISTALPMLFLLEGLKKISAEKASILSVLEPVFVVLFGVILLGEILSLTQLLGIMTILTGAILTLFSKNNTT